MTVEELIRLLSGLPDKNITVFSEGCDCEEEGRWDSNR